MSQYTIKYTDPLKTAFTVQPYTTNGRINPTIVDLDPNAVTSDTSLLIYGKGMPDYGQNIQTNMLHLLENFASPIEPLDATEGQLWYNNNNWQLRVYDTNPSNIDPQGWANVILDTGSTPMRGDFDLNNNRILNVPTAPISSTDAVNEQYVINSVSTHAADADLHLTDEQNQMLDGMETILGLNLSELDNKLTALEDFNTVGDTLTVQGALDLKADKSIPAATNNIATLDATGNLVDSGSQVSDFFPAGPHTHDATAVNFAGPYGNLSGANVQLVLQELEDEKAPKNSPTFTGTIISSGPITANGTITANGNVQLGVGARLFLAADPTASLEAATRQYVISQVAGGGISQPEPTRMITIADGTSSVYTTPAFTVGGNGLGVYINGQKQYNHLRSSITIYINENGFTGLNNDATTYSFDIQAATFPTTTVTVTGSLSQTPEDLVSQINGGMFNVSAVYNQSDSSIIFTAYSQNPPELGDLVITDIDLFSSIVPDIPKSILAANSNDSFQISGNYMHRAHPGSTFTVTGSTGNDGAYTVTSRSISFLLNLNNPGTLLFVTPAIPSTVADGVITFNTDIRPPVDGVTLAYVEQGQHNNLATTIEFDAVPSAGQVIEFVVFT